MKLNRILLPLTLLVSQMVCAAPNPQLKLPDFDSLTDKASKSVSIALDPALLGIATRFLDSGNPQDAAAKQLVSGLKGIYVKSFTFDEDFVYPKADVERVLKQLSAPSWQRLVEVRNRKEQTSVDIYVSMEQDKTNGLAIITSAPREFTIVNIVGSIDLQKLHQLEGQFGIPKLELEDRKRE